MTRKLFKGWCVTCRKRIYWSIRIREWLPVTRTTKYTGCFLATSFKHNPDPNRDGHSVAKKLFRAYCIFCSERISWSTRIRGWLPVARTTKYTGCPWAPSGKHDPDPDGKSE